MTWRDGTCVRLWAVRRQNIKWWLARFLLANVTLRLNRCSTTCYLIWFRTGLLESTLITTATIIITTLKSLRWSTLPIFNWNFICSWLCTCTRITLSCWMRILEIWDTFTTWCVGSTACRSWTTPSAWYIRNCRWAWSTNSRLKTGGWLKNLATNYRSTIVSRNYLFPNSALLKNDCSLIIHVSTCNYKSNINNSKN